MQKDTDGLNMPKFITVVRAILHLIRPKVRNLRYYAKCRLERAKHRNVFYLVFVPNKKHPGLADRIKAIISCYDLAKSNGYQFKLFFEAPFHLSKYLKPKQDWIAALEDLEYSLHDTRIIDEHYREEPLKLMPDKQYHCYNYDGHHMPRIFPDTGYKFAELFHELFEPCKDLKQAYSDFGIKEKGYVSCHLRFVNALEKFENTFFENYLETQEERNALIERCKEGIRRVMKKNQGKDVYVFSDSKVFLDSLSNIPVKVLPHDNIGHVSEETKADAAFKSFLDLYVMARGIAIYRFCAPELYSISHYALLAATVGDIPFDDIKV